MEQGKWKVVALQLDLLDNSPVVSWRNEVSGAVITTHPSEVIAAADCEVDRISIYTCGYLHGYADRSGGKALAEYLTNLFAQNSNSGSEGQVLVPGG